MNKKTNLGAFTTLISIFFFWGFVAASNDILIPVFKKGFRPKPTRVSANFFSFLHCLHS